MSVTLRRTRLSMPKKVLDHVKRHTLVHGADHAGPTSVRAAWHDIVNTLPPRAEVFVRLKSTAPDTTWTPEHWQQVAANHRALAPRLLEQAAHVNEY